MFRQIWIESGTAFYPSAVMLHHILQRREAAITHVRRGEGDVAERRRGEFSLVRIFAGNFRPARVGEFRVEPVVRESLALEQRPAVAMKTIGAVLLAARIKFRHEQFKAALLVAGKLRLPANSP